MKVTKRSKPLGVAETIPARQTRSVDDKTPDEPSAPGEPDAKAAALIAANERAAPGHGMTGPSSWVALRLSPDDVKRRSLKAVTKLLDATPLDTNRLFELARASVDGGFGATFAQAVAPHAARVIAATAGSASMDDVTGALELLQEAMPPEAWPAFADAVTPRVCEEVASLEALSREIMKIPRGVDGRATAKAVERVEHELVPRAKALRSLMAVAGLDLHALLATKGDPTTPSQAAKRVLDAAAKATGREVSIEVPLRAAAEEVLAAWLGREALVDTSEMSPTLVKHLLGRARTFHWDDTYGPDGIITGHYPGSDHGLLPHLQIHTNDGREVRVFFPKKFAKELE